MKDFDQSKTEKDMLKESIIKKAADPVKKTNESPTIKKSVPDKQEQTPAPPSSSSVVNSKP